MKRSQLSRRTPLRVDPEKTREFVERSRRQAAKRTMSKPRAISPASPAQRERVRDRICANCGTSGPCDPAHLTPRAQGGCDDPLCVIPLCRLCHDAFDRRDGAPYPPDLEPVLALPDFAAERAHMASHMSLRRCILRLTGRLETGL